MTIIHFLFILLTLLSCVLVLVKRNLVRKYHKLLSIILLIIAIVVPSWIYFSKSYKSPNLSREISAKGGYPSYFHFEGSEKTANIWKLRIPEEEDEYVLITVRLTVKNKGNETASSVMVIEASGSFEFINGELKSKGVTLCKRENNSYIDWGPLAEGNSFEYETTWRIDYRELKEIWDLGESPIIGITIYSREETINDHIEVHHHFGEGKNSSVPKPVKV